MSDSDDKFYDRADAYLDLANSQIKADGDAAGVSASFLYSASRFNTWFVAASFKKSKDMAAEKQEILEHFTKEYRLMMEENITDYIENFDEYMKVKK